MEKLNIRSLEKLISWPRNRRIAFLSDIEWVKQIIQAVMMAKILSEIGNIKIILIDYSKTFLPEVLENVEKEYDASIMENILISNSLKFNVSSKVSLHIHNPSANEETVHDFRKNIFKVSSLFTIITDNKSSRVLHQVRGLLKVFCSRVSQNVFMFKTILDKAMLEVSSRGIRDIYSVLPEGLRKILGLLQEASVEYGPLTVSDAVTIISHSIGVKRNVAHKILIKLIKYGAIKVEKNIIVI